jgi:teichuronic acid biosynthesis glycosyltransferase TuaC
VIRLRISHPRLHLFCIGEAALQPELETRAKDAGLARSIRFLGWRGSPEVASWLAAANVFRLPSYAEGCPNSVIEALADVLGQALSRRWDEPRISQRSQRRWDQVAEETRQACMECLGHR